MGYEKPQAVLESFEAVNGLKQPQIQVQCHHPISTGLVGIHFNFI